MNLIITQDNTRTETINSSIIDKLYEIAFAASSDPNSTVSLTGRLESPKGYKFKIDWLNTNFSPDLIISTTVGLYMTFYDLNLLNVLKNTVGDGSGVLIEEFLSITNDSLLGFGPSATAHPEITDFREGCLLTGLTLFNNGIPALTGLTFFGFPPNVTNFSNIFASRLHFDGIVVKNWNNFINRKENSNWWENGYYIYDMDNNGNITRIDELTLPDSVVTFPNDTSWKYSLCGAKLEELIIPATCTRLGYVAGPGIKKISFAPNSTLTTIVNGFYLNDNVSSSPVVLDVANLPLTITTIGNNAFRKCSNVTGILDLPNLTSLGQYSFYASRVTGATDLGSITEIPLYCFLYSGLLSITLPSTCTTIRSRGLSDMTTLTTVNGMSNVTTIEGYAFYNDTNLTGALSLQSLTTLGECAFQNTKITSITDLGRISLIPNSCFLNCTSLTSVILPSTCKTIGGQAFYGCTALTSINLDNIESISGYRAFGNAGITDYVLPKIKNFGARNLSGCSNAHLLDCGSDLTTIASDALWDSGFSIFIFRGTTPPSFSGTSFEYNMTGRIIYVPDAAVTDYQTAWPNMASYITGLSNYNPS